MHSIDDGQILEALDRVAKNDPDGLIRPVDVIEAARDPESPLHVEFEWDEGTAAHQYRLVQARRLIARVRVITEYVRPALVNVRVRSQDSGEERRGYVRTERAVADPDLYEQILLDARIGVLVYRNRLSAFGRAREAVAHLDLALARMEVDER